MPKEIKMGLSRFGKSQEVSSKRKPTGGHANHANIKNKSKEKRKGSEQVSYRVSKYSKGRLLVMRKCKFNKW